MSAITTAAPTRQKRPKTVRPHWAASSSIVVGVLVRDECMESPEGKKKPASSCCGLEEKAGDLSGLRGEWFRDGGKK